MRDIHFAPDQYYHIYNRGVDKRAVFLSPADYERFLESLYLFNDKRYDRKNGKILERVVQLASAEAWCEERDCLVSVAAFKLMSNHFHLQVREEQEGGVSEFMHRVATGYTNYFNLRQGRTGSLFEGPFKAVHIQSDAQLQHTIRYTHLNELDRHGIPWRNGEIEDWNRCLELLDQDPYSSHGSYCGRSQKLPIVDADIVSGLFPDSQEYINFLRGWTQRSLLDLPRELFELS